MKRPKHTVLVLRTCSADLTSYNGFKWPKRGAVKAPDWNGKYSCGGGLHGLLWGEGNAEYLNWSESAKWQVVKCKSSDVIHGKGGLSDKCKFSHGTVVFCGERSKAIEYMVARGADARKIVSGTATAGDSGTATAGDSGTATAGDSGTATAGDSGTATAGYRGTATGGKHCLALAGDKVRADEFGVLLIRWWDEKRWRISMGYVGEDGIKLNTWYKSVGGKLVEA